MYYLTSTLVKGNTRRLTSLLSAFFYAMIPYVVGSNFLLPLPTTSLFYSSLPLILALYIKGVNERRGFKWAFIVCLIWVLTTTSAYLDFPYAIVTWAFLGLYYIFHIIINKGDRSTIASSSRFTFYLLLLWGLMNLYWFLPVAFYSSFIFQTASVAGTSSTDWLRVWSANLLDLMRLRGSFSLMLNTQGDYYAPWSVVYSNSIFVVISFALPAIAFASTLFSRKDRYVLYFSFLALLGLFLIKGPYPPLGEVTVFLYNAIWPLQIFRSTYLRFLPMITLSYAFLIGYFVGHLYPANLFHKLRHKIAIRSREVARAMVVGFIVFLLFGVYLYPVWDGEVIYSGGQVVPSARVKIPDYYAKAADWLSEDNGDYNIMSLPMGNIKGYEEFSWDSGYAGAGLTSFALNKPVIGSGDIFNGLSGFVARKIVQNATDGIGKTLSLMRVKYILLHNDANWRFITEPNYGGFIYTSQENFKSILDSTNSLGLERNFGELDFYQNQYPVVPTVYSAIFATFVSGGSDQMITVAGREDFAPDKTVLLLSKDLNSRQQSTLESQWGVNEENTYSTENLAGFYVPKNGNYTILVTVSNSINAENRTFAGRIDKQDVIFVPDISNYIGEESSYMHLRGGPLYLNSGYHSLSISSRYITLSVSDGWANPMNWNSTLENTDFAARFYSFPPWKAVVKTDFSATNDTMSFSSLDIAPYLFPAFSPREWNAADSTLVYLKTENESLVIDTILADNIPPRDFNVFWETGWMGIATKSISFPIVIPSHQKAIIQINQKASNVTLISNPPDIKNLHFYSLETGGNVPSDKVLGPNQTIDIPTEYKEINPTKYLVNVNASTPFFLVLSESYDKNWVASINGQEILDGYHFIANGYANGWFINETGAYTITLEFWPQNLFYTGAAISIVTLILCTFYVNKNTFKNMYKKYVNGQQESD